MAPSKKKPRWVMRLSMLYSLLLIPSILFLGSGFALGSKDKDFAVFISLGLLMCASLIVAIAIGFKKSNDLHFSSNSRKLMLAPIYLIIMCALAPMLADVFSSILESIFGLRNSERAIFYVLLIGCSISYYSYFKKTSVRDNP